MWVQTELALKFLEKREENKLKQRRANLADWILVHQPCLQMPFALDFELKHRDFLGKWDSGDGIQKEAFNVVVQVSSRLWASDLIVRTTLHRPSPF